MESKRFQASREVLSAPAQVYPFELPGTGRIAGEIIISPRPGVVGLAAGPGENMLAGHAPSWPHGNDENRTRQSASLHSTEQKDFIITPESVLAALSENRGNWAVRFRDETLPETLNSCRMMLGKIVVPVTMAGCLWFLPVALPEAGAATYSASNYAELVTAINTANSAAGDDTINLTADITLSGNLPLILSNITFEGNSHSVSGADTYRVFFVGRGATGSQLASAPAVTFKNMTIQNGKAQGGSGSGGGAGLGGGLFIYDGTVTVQNATFSNNIAAGGTGAASNGGGGGMGGSGNISSYGGGGGLWAGANGGYGSFSSAAGGGSAGNYGGGGGSSYFSGSNGGGMNGGAGTRYSGGGGGYNGGNGSTSTGGSGGWGGGGGGSYNTSGAGGFGGGGGSGFNSGSGTGGFGGGGGSAVGGNPGGAGGFGGGSGFRNSGSSFGGGSNGGGGAGFGGGLFVRTGTLALQTVAFTSNQANHGTGTANGQGKGAGLFILSSLTNINGNNQGMPGALPSIDPASCGVTFSGNAAQDDAAAPTDSDDVYGSLGSATNACPGSTTTTVVVSSTTTVEPVSSTTTIDVSSTTTIAPVSSTTTIDATSTTTVAPVSSTTTVAAGSSTTTIAAGSTTTTTTASECSVRILPKRIGWFMGDKEKTRFLWVMGPKGAAYDENTDISWSTDAIETLHMRVLFKRLLLLRVSIDGAALDKGDYTLSVDNCTGTVHMAR